MSLLDTPVRVDREAERLYFFNGTVSVDLNGDEAKRKVVLEFLAQAQEMARVIVDGGTTRYAGEWHTDACAQAAQGMWCEPECQRVRAILQAARVLPCEP